MGKENQWAFNVQIPTLIPFLTYAQNRELREDAPGLLHEGR